MTPTSKMPTSKMPTSMMPTSKSRIIALAALTLCLGLCACGKKEPLKPPQGATYPRQYPPAAN